jgi:hypothetical protein
MDTNALLYRTHLCVKSIRGRCQCANGAGAHGGARPTAPNEPCTLHYPSLWSAACVLCMHVWRRCKAQWRTRRREAHRARPVQGGAFTTTLSVSNSCWMHVEGCHADAPSSAHQLAFSRRCAHPLSGDTPLHTVRALSTLTQLRAPHTHTHTHTHMTGACCARRGGSCASRGATSTSTPPPPTTLAAAAPVVAPPLMTAAPPDGAQSTAAAARAAPEAAATTTAWRSMVNGATDALVEEACRAAAACSSRTQPMHLIPHITSNASQHRRASRSRHGQSSLPQSRELGAQASSSGPCAPAVASKQRLSAARARAACASPLSRAAAATRSGRVLRPAGGERDGRRGVTGVPLPAELHQRGAPPAAAAVAGQLTLTFATCYAGHVSCVAVCRRCKGCCFPGRGLPSAARRPLPPLTQGQLKVTVPTAMSAIECQLSTPPCSVVLLARPGEGGGAQVLLVLLC